MVMRESVIWRWSHNRHHSDTIIVGRDPEIAVPRPPDVKAIVMNFFGLRVYAAYFRAVAMHCLGRMSAAEKTFVPGSEFERIYRNARIYAAIYAAVIALSVYTRSILPLLFVGLTSLFGTWLMVVYGLTQHAGLAENVLDHRLNCRTVYKDPVNRFLYWNMNYHVEHHMFPLVPYHALPRLHEAVKSDCPVPYTGIFNAWREIIAAISRQVKDPAWHVKRRLPEPASRDRKTSFVTVIAAEVDGWVPVCAARDLPRADVIRLDCSRKTYAVYRDDEGKLYATDGLCTHGNTHLADGLVKDSMIERPRHNGRFHLRDGSPARTPICRGLATYPVAEREGRIFVDISRPGGAGSRAAVALQLRVVSNRCIATFIKELVLAPVDSTAIPFTPGDYIQLDIPAYDAIHFRDFDISEPFATVWRNQHVFDLVARNPRPGRRNNYSLACDPRREGCLRFNVRIATPPPGQDCAPGVGSSYVFSLKPGDLVSATGPSGDFHIKPTQREMVYIGGGAGMAPLRAHLSHLLEAEASARRISYWYGARSRQEIFYEDYFRALEERSPNFSFHLALSASLAEDGWTGHTGFIHDVVLAQHLRNHPNARAVEYYLCGPPMMIRACNRMLAPLGVPSEQIAYDEF